MQKRTKKHNIKRKILSALITSAIGAATLNPLAFALPVQEGDMTADVTITPTDNNLRMDITSAATNNVINWKEFNIAKNETVAFDANDYLNLINDTKMSEIWGKLTGGSDGSIYLINPNGILFGKGAIVDVGTLYASTREISNTLQSDFESSGTLPELTAATGDIINMGTLKAAQNITLEGKNIVIESNDNDNGIQGIIESNDDDNGIQGINAAGDVYFVVNAGGSVQVGKVTDDNTNGFKITTGEHQSGTIDTTTDFKLVRNVDELQDINDNLSGNYMLAGDIAGTSDRNFEPIGTSNSKFTGRFNGLYYSVKNLFISKPGVKYVGLFSIIGSDSIVERFTRDGGSTKGKEQVSAIVGRNAGGTVRNVTNTGEVIATESSVGGIVGKMAAGMVENVLNTGNVSSINSKDNNNIAGIVGRHDDGTIENAINTGNISGNNNVGGIIGFQENSPHFQVTNVRNDGNISGHKYVSGIVGNKGTNSTFENYKNTGKITVNGVDKQSSDSPYDDSWEKYIPLYTTPSSGDSDSGSSGGSTTPTSTDTDTSSDDDSSDDTDTTPTIPTTPTTPTVPLTPTTPTTPVEETTPQTPTVEPTVAPTPAETEPVAPVIEPKTEPVSLTVTQTATTTLEKVLQSVGKTQEGGNNAAENITMKNLTEAENVAASNAQTATNSPAINSAAQIPQTSTDTVTTTTTISTSSDSSTTSTPSKQSAPSVSTTSTRNTSSASSDNNASANATIITDDKLSIVNQGGNMPASMSVDAIAAQESKSANADNTADTTQSVETSQNNEDKKEK